MNPLDTPNDISLAILVLLGLCSTMCPISGDLSNEERLPVWPVTSQPKHLLLLSFLPFLTLFSFHPWTKAAESSRIRLPMGSSALELPWLRPSSAVVLASSCSEIALYAFAILSSRAC